MARFINSMSNLGSPARGSYAGVFRILESKLDPRLQHYVKNQIFCLVSREICNGQYTFYLILLSALNMYSKFVAN